MIAADVELLTVRQLAAALKLSRATVWRLTAAADAGLPTADGFPRPVRLGRRIVRWRASDVAAYLGRLAGVEAAP